MNRLFDLVLAYRHTVIFVALSSLSLVFLFRFNQEQSLFFTQWSLAVGGYLHAKHSAIVNYLNLGEENRKLQAENIALRRKAITLETQLNAYKYRAPYSANFSVLPDSAFPISRYVFIPCRAIENSVLHHYNHIVLNVGRRHGVEPQMGVISAEGVVGVVTAVSENYSLGMSLLNKNLKLSAQIHGKKVRGLFQWDGASPRFGSLHYIPLHYKVEIGDTVSTSQYSTIFPEGMIIGVVSHVNSRESDGFYDIGVRLNTDFHALDYLYVVKHAQKHEIDSLLRAIR
ncbi:MAG: rod shape-determining protein MreC [Bacteroidia bacterium]|nr:rod shape-determining protein MreC [Bacteroidia bacterium]MDW8333380.1 rod shape-determining protein MreC [Bacteroidia bacterium]